MNKMTLFLNHKTRIIDQSTLNFSLPRLSPQLQPTWLDYWRSYSVKAGNNTFLPLLNELNHFVADYTESRTRRLHLLHLHLWHNRRRDRNLPGTNVRRARRKCLFASVSGDESEQHALQHCSDLYKEVRVCTRACISLCVCVRVCV